MKVLNTPRILIWIMFTVLFNLTCIIYNHWHFGINIKMFKFLELLIKIAIQKSEIIFIENRVNQYA